MSKFKIGDLVTLSSAGRKSDNNSRVYGCIGIVWEVGKIWSDFPIEVKWIGSKIYQSHSSPDMLPMKEYELKFAKNGVVVKH